MICRFFQPWRKFQSLIIASYKRIVDRIVLLHPLSHDLAMITLSWMTCCRRPLLSSELLDAIIFGAGSQTLTERSKLLVTILDLCKPLVQTHNDGHVSFVHFTVQE
jgi:hypothetical protein